MKTQKKKCKISKICYNIYCLIINWGYHILFGENFSDGGQMK